METKTTGLLTEETFSPQLRTLEWLIKNYRRGDIQLPTYQRKPVWTSKQRIAWAQSIKKLVAVATFFVYKLPDSNTWWLADGSQRLHATLEIIEHPKDYQMTKDEIERAIDRCNISVAFLRCGTHDEGYYHFIHLNRGFAPTPAEVYKGFLVQTEMGKWVYEEAEKRIGKLSERIVRKPRGSARIVGSKESRDNLALFFQYVTRTETRRFWSVASSAIGEFAHPLEQQLSIWVAEHSRDELESSMREFAEYIKKLTDMIVRNTVKRKGENFPLSSSLYRHLLHFGIYCRNTGYPNEHRDRIIDYIILCSDNGNARLNMVDANGKFIRSENAHLDELSKVEPLICEFLNLPWENRRPSLAKEAI